MFCEAAKRQGYAIIAIAIKKDTSPKIRKLVDKVYWLSLSEFERIFEIFNSEGVKKIVMVGQVSPVRLFSREVKNSQVIQQILARIKNKKADTILGAIAQKLEEHGLTLMDSHILVKDLMAKRGALTLTKPDPLTQEDINFGFELAKAVAALDIGQTVAVKDKAIVAVEALEGTDNLIRRAGKICRGGMTVVKVAKPKQDMRFDIPVIGLTTIQNLIRAGAKCLAIETDKTLFIDQESTLKLADKKGISIVGV